MKPRRLAVAHRVPAVTANGSKSSSCCSSWSLAVTELWILFSTGSSVDLEQGELSVGGGAHYERNSASQRWSMIDELTLQPTSPPTPRPASSQRARMIINQIRQSDFAGSGAGLDHRVLTGSNACYRGGHFSAGRDAGAAAPPLMMARPPGTDMDTDSTLGRGHILRSGRIVRVGTGLPGATTSQPAGWVAQPGHYAVPRPAGIGYRLPPGADRRVKTRCARQCTGGSARWMHELGDGARRIEA